MSLAGKLGWSWIKKATFAQVLRPVRLSGAMLQEGTHFLESLVDGANTGEAYPSVDQIALMIQHVSSEQLAFTLLRAHQDWLRTLVLPMPQQKLLKRHEGQITLWLADFHRIVFTVDEDLRELSGQQLASEFRLKLEAVLESNQTARREAYFRVLQQRYAPVV